MIRTGSYPDRLKLAKIFLIFKGNEKQILGNYRLISLLSWFNKIFEYIINARLNIFLARNDLLCANQFGFRKNSNTIVPLSELSNHMQTAIDDKKLGCCVFLDIAKAFDVVKHDILILKLECMGIPNSITKLLTCYLTNRSQYILHDGLKSNICKTNTGVPQGSILGPTLFNIYVNDLPNFIQNSEVAMFADDVACFNTNHDINTLYQTMQQDLKAIEHWYASNHLAININKSNFIIFKSRANINKVNDIVKINNLTLSIYNNTLAYVSSTKYLGLIFDEVLNWNSHVDKIAKTINIQIGALYKIKKLVPRKVLLSFYYANIHSHIIYALPIWGANYNKCLHPIIIAQKKAVRIIGNVGYIAHTRDLFTQFAILNVEKLWAQSTACHVYKIFNNIYPHNISINLTENISTNSEWIISTRTRNAKTLVLPSPNSNYGKFAMSFCGPWVWNQLPEKIRKACSINTFKISSKKYYLECSMRSLIG